MKLKTVWYKWAYIEVHVYESWIFTADVFNKSCMSPEMNDAINMAKQYVDDFIKEEAISFQDLINLTLWLVRCSEGGNVESIDEDWFKVIIDKYIKSSKCV